MKTDIIGNDRVAVRNEKEQTDLGDDVASVGGTVCEQWNIDKIDKQGLSFPASLTFRVTKQVVTSRVTPPVLSWLIFEDCCHAVTGVRCAFWLSWELMEL